VAAVDCVAARPAMLFTVLWSAHAVRFPYGNLVHDARLYAFQVQNQMSGGAFAGDLFLRFGSQDEFTPFSRLVAPIAAVFGIDWTFFSLFLVFDALLILALQRLVIALVEDRVTAAVALLATVVAALPYGGLRIFHVFEFFFTPRLISCGLVLFALERTLRRQYVAGLAFAAAATVIHPLMGFAAVAIGLWCAILDRLPRRWIVAAIVVAAAAGIAVLGYRPLGVRVFGTLDPEWLEVTRQASAYNFPAFWTTRDWINVAMSIALPAWAAVMLWDESPHRARFLGVSAVLGVVGVVTMFVAGAAPYRILLQGQPYRALWVLAALRIPIAFWLATRIFRRAVAAQVVAILLVASVDVTTIAAPEVVFSLLGIAAFLIVLNRGTPQVDFNRALVRSLVGGISVGFVLAALIRAYRIGIRTSLLMSTVGSKTYVDVVLGAPGVMIWLGLLLGVLMLLIGRRTPGLAFTAGGLALAVVIHFAAFLNGQLPGFREAETSYGRDLPFIQSYFQHRPHDGVAPPTVYEGVWESTTLIWFDLQSTVYFNLEQMSGVLFNRETGIEGKRRASIVRPFELARYNAVADFIPWADRLMITSLFGPPEQAAPATRRDVELLCGSHEQVDVAILNRDFGGLAVATNGRIFLYECAQVRAAR
jgi:hypothetical protein